MKICRVEKKREVVDVKYEVCDKYCCNKMKKWLNISLYPSRHTLWYDINARQYLLEVREKDNRCHSTHNNDDYLAREEMNYCPFCGAKLQEKEITEVEENLKDSLKRALTWR